MTEPSSATGSAEWIGGRNAVSEALRSDRQVHEILVARGTQPALLAGLQEQAQRRRIPVRQVERQRLDTLAPRHQGVVARVAAFSYATLDEILEKPAARREAPLVVVADGIQDPQNLGTLIRTLEAVGGHGLVLPRHRAVGVTPGTVKASAGAVQFLPVAQVTNIPRALDQLRERGLWVAGLDAAGPARLRDLPADAGLALVVGSEGRGLGRLTREHCDLLVGLPMSGRVASLNAAMAGSIALYHVWERRHAG